MVTISQDLAMNHPHPATVTISQDLAMNRPHPATVGTVIGRGQCEATSQRVCKKKITGWIGRCVNGDEC